MAPNNRRPLPKYACKTLFALYLQMRIRKLVIEPHQFLQPRSRLDAVWVASTCESLDCGSTQLQHADEITNGGGRLADGLPFEFMCRCAHTPHSNSLILGSDP